MGLLGLLRCLEVLFDAWCYDLSCFPLWLGGIIMNCPYCSISICTPFISIMFIITVTDKGFLVWNKICVFLFPLESSSIRTCWNRRAFNLHIVAPPLLPSWWLPSTWWRSSPSCSSPLASPLPALCLKNLSHVKGPEWYVWLPVGQHFFAVGLNHHLPSWFTNVQHIFSSNWRRRAVLLSEAG